MPVVDTEFLFGIRSTDPRHVYVRSILETKRKDLVVPPLAIFELVIVCLSEGKTPEVVIQILELIESVVLKYDLKIMSFDIEQLMEGLAVYKDFKKGFFDSLIAGSALTYDGVIIADDEHFLGIRNSERKTLRQYLRE